MACRFITLGDAVDRAEVDAVDQAADRLAEVHVVDRGERAQQFTRRSPQGAEHEPLDLLERVGL
jgi:hypothetical protein